MKPQNITEIRKKSLHFSLLFIVLICFSIVPAYFFVWAAGQQKKAFIERLQEYRQVQNKQLLLKEKIDSLYIQLNYVNFDWVTNPVPLERVILENKHSIELNIGADSTASFKAYAVILKNLNTQLYIKDSIVKMVSIENTITTDLLNCIEMTKKVRQDVFTQTHSSSTR